MSRDWIDVRVATYNIHRAQGLDRRTRPDRIAACSATIDADIVALQEVIGPGLGSGPGRSIGAALGMGWIMAPTRSTAASVWQRRAEPLPDRRPHQLDLTLEDLRAAQFAARRDRSWRGPAACSCTTCTSARRCSNGGIRRPNSRRGFTTAARPGPKIVLGDFNEWGRGLVSDVLAARLQSVDLFPHLRRRRTYPGFFPVLHLDHIYFSGDIEVGACHAAPHATRLVASDHLPLVADIRVGPASSGRRN